MNHSVVLVALEPVVITINANQGIASGRAFKVVGASITRCTNVDPAIRSPTTAFSLLLFVLSFITPQGNVVNSTFINDP